MFALGVLTGVLATLVVQALVWMYLLSSITSGNTRVDA